MSQTKPQTKSQTKSPTKSKPKSKSPQSDTRTFTVPSEAAGQRLDAWLTAQLETVSRSRVRLLLDNDQVHVDGAIEKASLKLRGGETVEVHGEPEPPPLRAMAEEIPLSVVYEDKDLIVVDKPAGMMVHAGSGATDSARNRGTLVNALLGRHEKLSKTGGDLRPGIVHRLDKLTSGLIIVARNDAAHLQLAEMFSERRIRKTYLALVHGHLEQDRGTINAAIARDVIRRTRMTTRRTEGARSAISHYRVQRRIESSWGKFTLVSVRIETGRTHQIRVHLSSIGHPIAGDTHYGAPAIILPHAAQGPRRKNMPTPQGISLSRNFLHAAELEFIHPRTGKPLHLEAPLPAELTGFLHQIES